MGLFKTVICGDTYWWEKGDLNIIHGLMLSIIKVFVGFVCGMIPW